MIPGLLGLVVMFMTTLMTALGVVRERELGTMEQLVVTPLRPLELMLGKILPYLLVGAVDFALVFAAGLYLFDLTFAGNLPLFLLLSLLLVLTTLGLGLLISTVSQNQQQAMQLAMFAMLPQILLSGFIFPLDAMPRAIKAIAYLLPFTHFVPIAQGMFIKGQGLDLLWPQVAVLAAYAVVVVGLATARFRKRIAWEVEPVEFALRLSDVTRRFGSRVGVEGISLTVAPGELVGLVGPDGSGKTTLARLAAGVIAPTSGTVEPESRGRAGYLTGRFSLYPELTVLENLRFFARLHGMKGAEIEREAERLLGWMGLLPFTGRRAGALSGGMRQKLALVCAVIHRPPLLILDEPTTAVDPVARSSSGGS